MFEKWKEERGHLLREKRRQQKEAEDKLQLQKQEQEEEKKKINKSAFSDWWGQTSPYLISTFISAPSDVMFTNQCFYNKTITIYTTNHKMAASAGRFT